MNNSKALFFWRLMWLLLVVGPLGAAASNSLAVLHVSPYDHFAASVAPVAPQTADHWKVTTPFDRQNDPQLLPERSFEWEEEEDNEHEQNALTDSPAGAGVKGLSIALKAIEPGARMASEGRLAYAATPWYIVIQVFRI